MNPDKRNRRISDIKLERYLLGELSKSEMSQVKQILEEDEESRARLAALEQSNREILEQYPADLMSRQIQFRLDRRMPQHSLKSLIRPWPLTALMGSTAVMILLFVVFPSNFLTFENRENTLTERIKGQVPNIKLYRKTEGGSEELRDSALAYQGDVIRIGYQAADHPYGIILSVDGRGTVTLHLPHQGNRSVRLTNGGRVLLDFALELDDAPRWERFYFVTGNAPFDVAPILLAAKQIDVKKTVDQLGKLNLPKDLNQFVFSLEKGAR